MGVAKGPGGRELQGARRKGVVRSQEVKSSKKMGLVVKSSKVLKGKNTVVRDKLKGVM